MVLGKARKEKAGKETSMDMAEYLEEEEVQKLIDSASTSAKENIPCMHV